uniref:Putative capsid protein n=1 Tax=viral metagenome TaxID=1070528 RepID=A0A6M3LFJ3_9ZZZZ
MPIQTATTGNLENAQRVAIAESLYTAEHSAPCSNLIRKFKLGKGEKQLTVPKVGQMEASNLTDGEDIVDSEDIGMTTTDLTTSEVGMKVIITDKLVRQANDDVFRMVGVQMGQGMVRKKEADIIALFPALNGGTVLGADDKNLTAQNFAACIAQAKANKYPSPIFAVHHPNAVFALTASLSPVGATASVAIPRGFSEDKLRDFYKITLNQVPIFETGNIAVIAGYASAYGVIASRDAMCILESTEMNKENERDASLRAWEMIITSDYGCFELDDTYGAAMQYEIGNPATNN